MTNMQNINTNKNKIITCLTGGRPQREGRGGEGRGGEGHKIQFSNLLVSLIYLIVDKIIFLFSSALNEVWSYR